MKEKKKIIFLDIDGVLNGYNPLNLFGWNIVSKLHVGENWYRKVTSPCGVHESKVKRLAKIVRETNAKVVMSSTWRSGYWKLLHQVDGIEYKCHEPNLIKLATLLQKYNIHVIDITPKSSDGRREDEIVAWLSRHEDEVESYLVLDDEKTDLQCFVDDRLVQTVSGKGRWKYMGLKNTHINQSIDILNRVIVK